MIMFRFDISSSAQHVQSGPKIKPVPQWFFISIKLVFILMSQTIIKCQRYPGLKKTCRPYGAVRLTLLTQTHTYRVHKISPSYYHITLRLFAVRAMLTRYQLSSSVRLSVRPSQIGVVQRWLNLGLREERRTIAQGLQFSDAKKSWRNSNDITPNGGAKQRWGRFRSALCDQYLAISQKRCKIGTQLLWKANRDLHALYRMVILSMTLGDP